MDTNNPTTLKKRFTIGFLSPVFAPFDYPSWLGVADSASQHDANAVCFVSGKLNQTDNHVLYELINNANVDGLVYNPVEIGASTAFSMESMLSLIAPYRSQLPMVSMALPLEGIPCVPIDYISGYRAVITHLTVHHGYRRIVFIGGPDLPESELRRAIYEEILAEHGQSYDPTLVLLGGTWFEPWGEEAMVRLLDERKLRPGVDFEAIAAANDAIARGAIKVLRARGFHVPRDVAIVGFDDHPAFKFMSPPLTTASMGRAQYQTGWQAAEALLAQLAGAPISDLAGAPPELMIRQSCGCLGAAEAAGVGLSTPGSPSTSQFSLPTAPDALLAQMMQALKAPPEYSRLADEVLHAFQAELQPDQKPGRGFLFTLSEAINETTTAGCPVDGWQKALSLLRAFTLNQAGEAPRAATNVEALIGQGRALIGDALQWEQAAQAVNNDDLNQALHKIGQDLHTASNLPQLTNLLAESLPSLGIPHAAFSLYEDPAKVSGLVRPMLIHGDAAPSDQPGKASENPQPVIDQPFPAAQLAPLGWLADRRHTLIVEPLHTPQGQLGLAVLEFGTRNEQVYETLRSQLSSALSGVLLLRERERLLSNVERHALQLQTAAEVSRATSSVLDTDALIQQAVQLVGDRFGLYYVGLFLLDAARRRAVLHAGTGEVGKQMMAKGHHLEVNESSMVGWCITHRQARLALDVGAEAVRFNNPLLPETHSELALPLIARGQVIGAMTVQSKQISAFTQEDVDTIQTMADQLANAIENARLFEQTQQRAAELAKAKEAAEGAKEEAERARKEAETEKEAAESAREEAEKARKESEAANQSLALQMWQTTGQALLNERMRGEQDIPTLARNVIQQLCKYINAQMGALYILEEDVLHLAGTYAGRQKLKEQYAIGEGLVGEAALGKETIVSTVPDEYINPAPSTIDEIFPKYFIVIPLTYDDQATGVVEIGSLREFTPIQTEFLNKAIENVAIAFMTAQARQRVNELYAKTRQQAEELQAQEEELRATNEELEAQTESLRASETKLKENQGALEAANADLEEKTHILQEQQAKVDQQNRELERKAEELATASKYKSEFLANMSHELRTPLNSMLILSGMLAKNEEGNLSPDQVESAQVIYSGGNDLLNLINEILDLAKVEAGKMEFHFAPMEWDYLISRMKAQFDPLSQRKGLQFITSVASDVPVSIVTDEQRLAQIVKNLLSNSFKFTEQGSVSLTIQRAASGSGFDPAQFVAVNVTDTGIGMTPEQQRVVFEAFTQADGSTSRQYGGTGLGLTITREMTHRLGGQVVLSSEQGKGSTFTIYLPLKGAEENRGQATGDGEQSLLRQAPGDKGTSHPFPVTSHSPSPTPSPLPLSTPSPSIPDDRDTITADDHLLLIVEDDPSFAKIVLDYAHKKGFKAIAASDGESALQLLQAHMPHAVVLDLGLPRMSGWEVLDQIKSDPDTRHIPIHIISAEEEDLTAFQRGAIGFLTKPVSQEGLDDAFQHIEQLITAKIKSLLLVEDDDALRMSVRKLLEGNDIAITEASLGQTALEKLTSQHFDCMILDLTLPDMTGFELLGHLHNDEAIPKCPVIIYTGRELSPDENQELLKYADSVIVKGVKSPDRLLDETALFLHRVIANLPEDKQRTIRKLHNPEGVLEGKQILLVDDDTRNAFALSKLLADKGMKMHIAGNGLKALEALDKLPLISLVLTDIMMPGMDGYELIKHIRQQSSFKSLPIIALTAKAMKGDREKCLEAGANDYLSKPIDPDRLFSMLRVWLSR